MQQLQAVRILRFAARPGVGGLGRSATRKARKLSRRTRAIIGSLVVVTAMAGALPQVGEAATSNVTINYGNWNCTQGGAVTGLGVVSIDRGGEGVAWGTNRIKLWSQLGVRVQISARIFCSRAWWQGGGYYTDVRAWRYFYSNALTAHI